MSAESDLLEAITDTHIQGLMRIAFSNGWKVDRRKRSYPKQAYLIWPASKATIAVPLDDQDQFRSAVRRMEHISNKDILPRKQHHRPKPRVVAQTNGQQPPVSPKADLNLRLETLCKEHHQLSWEYKILVWDKNNTPEEISQAQAVLNRMHLIEAVLLEMGRPLLEWRTTR